MRYLFRITLALILTLVIFILGLVHGKNVNLGQATSVNGFSLAREYFARSSYPGVKETSLGDKLKINGVPTTISSFKTKDSPSKVLDYYTQRWTRQGLKVVKQADLNYASLGTFDLKKRKFRGILVFRDMTDYSTLVFPFIIELNQKPVESKIKDIPEPSDIEGKIHLEACDSGLNSDTMAYMANGSVEHNLRYYLSRMPANGWDYQPMAGSLVSREGKSLFFQKDGRECVVNIQSAGPEGSYVLINVVN